MKRLLGITCSILATGSCAKDMKIGFIEPTTIIVGSKKWEDCAKEAKTELEGRGQKITKKQQTLQADAKKLESMGSAASKNARQDLEEKMAKLRNEIEIEYQSLQAYEQRMSQEAQMDIVKDIEQATQEIAAEEDMDMVTAGAIVFAKKEFNMTPKVLARVNDNYAANKKKTDAAVKVAKVDKPVESTKVAKTDAKKSESAA